jgi:hypothetical protein
LIDLDEAAEAIARQVGLRQRGAGLIVPARLYGTTMRRCHCR